MRTEPASLAHQVLDASIHARLRGMAGDHRIFIEPMQIRVAVDVTSRNAPAPGGASW